ncbi:peptidoglycan-binding protein [Streptomyces sp. CA-250714]|uniref:peptidoglycan-binding protein n=1 Tax=Streptomyces sp. CA-250714 TaxID=3240060 RepID=UPI003D8E7D9A
MNAHDEPSAGMRAPEREPAASGPPTGSDPEPATAAAATAADAAKRVAPGATAREASDAAPEEAASAVVHDGGDSTGEGNMGEDGADKPGPGRGTRRALRVSLLVLAAATAVGAAGVAATGAFGGDGESSGAPRDTGPRKTAPVERTTLTRTETVDGTLGFGTPTTVQQAATEGEQNSGTGSGQQPGAGAGGSSDGGGSGEEAGIVTWLPEEGATLSRGDTVYSVDEHKVPLLYGSKPFYRTMRAGTEGDDVKTLERNLAKLGYSGFTVDDTFTSGTAGAVRDWQDDMHRAETGEVAPGDAVVASGARRVAEQKTSPGALAGGEALTWTGTDRIVEVELEAGLESLVKKGTKATIRLPDGGTAQAEVTDVGTPSGAQDGAGDGQGAEGGGEGDGSEEATLPVELEVGSQQKLGRYQAASVDVVLKAQTRENVLAVPVNALLAEPGGGYAVEARGADERSRRIPVELGMFADGKVEVSGKGVNEGLDVGVPR